MVLTSAVALSNQTAHAECTVSAEVHDPEVGTTAENAVQAFASTLHSQVPQFATPGERARAAAIAGAMLRAAATDATAANERIF
jgi:hypothetical protein